jgi:cytohesin
MAAATDPVTGASPLHSAAANGKRGAASLLLSKGKADVGAVDRSGDTPLHVASRIGDASLAGLLATWPGCDTDALNDVGSAPLHVAATGGHVAVLEALGRSGAALDTQTRHRKETALWVASRGDQAAAVAALCALGASKDLGDREGWAPLHVAVAKQSLTSLTILVDQRASADATAHDGATPLVLAARLGHAPEAAKLVLGTVRFKRIAADLNLAAPGGETPLIAAAKAGHLNVVEVLIAAGARLDERTSPEGETALFLAAQAGHLSIVQRLVSLAKGHYTVDLDIPTTAGEAPLQAAARGGFKDVCQVLVAAGAKEFKASAKGAELAGLLAGLGVTSTGMGPFGAQAPNTMDLPGPQH